MADAWQRFYVNVQEATALYQTFLQLRRQCAQVASATRDPQFLALERQIAAIQTQFSNELDAMAAKTALYADKAIVADLRGKLVRDPTGNRPGIEGSIWSTPVSTGPFSFGMVEVALIANLDATVGDVSGVPYWALQEFGSSAMLGRVIHGVFVGGAGVSFPSQSEFRLHPAFVAGPGGWGTINQPIPAKHFLRDGTAEAWTYWQGLKQAAVQRAASRLRALKFPLIP